METFSQHYLGPKTRSFVASMLQANEFVIFYPITNVSSSPTESFQLPLQIPLTLAYRTTDGILYEFPLRKEFGRWSIAFNNGKHPSKTKNEMPDFQSLTALIDYYRTYSYINAKTNQIEVLPIWNDNANDNSSEDSESTSESLYDFLDNVSESENCYSSMQSF